MTVSDGTDTRAFADEWMSAGRQLEDVASSLRAYGQRLVGQAEEQDQASGGAGGARGGGGGPRGRDAGGVRSGNPDITEDLEDAEYEDVDGPLVDDGGVEPDDVKQGALGDCWLISSMRGIANSPAGAQLLARNIEDNGDGTYDVTLYEDGEPVVVTVSGEIPVEDGDPVYADNDGGGRELWPLLYEKAMAEHFGGEYADLDGDWPANALETLTGNEVETYDDGFGWWDDKDYPSAQELQDELDAGGVIIASTDGDGKKASDGQLYSNHAYTVTDVDPGAGTVTVQNPWGSGYPPITMSYEDFEDGFARLDVGSTT